MTNVGPQPPTQPQPSWWQRWWIVVVAMIGTLPVVLITAAMGYVDLSHFAGGDPDPVRGTAFWVASATVLGVGVAAPPGPARRTRLIVAVVVATVWFVVGRLVLGPQ
jgi:hypothetical protein